MAKLTKRFIESIKTPESGYKLYWDDELKGFGVKVTQGGIITFVCFYRNKRGQQRRIAFGRYGVMTALEARPQARSLLGRVASGEDPAGERKHARGEATFGVLAQEYIERRANEKKSGREDTRIIARDLLKPWGNLLAKEIRRRDVIELVDEIKDRGAPIMANRTLAVIRRVFNFGINRDIVESNPTVLVKAPGKETRRERALNAEEIKQLWERLGNMQGAGSLVRAAIQLILITGQRSGEILSMEWNEIDFDSATWEIPSTKTKNVQPHRVPLSSMALKIISGLPKQASYVFPSRIGTSIDETRPMKSGALAHAIRKNRELLGLEQFCPHDLRRTCASGLASVGVERFIISRILNHTERNVTAIYDRYSYDKEKRLALNLWAAKLEEIVTGKKTKVIPIAG
jgi:integrase